MNAARRDLWWLLAATFLILASGYGLKDPWPPDAPRFALVARDMLATGDWLIPRVGGDLYADKPPLFMWLQAAAIALTGSVRSGYLLPALVAGLGTMTLVYDLATRLWGKRAGLGAGIALLATIQFPLTFKAGQIDPVLCFWATLSLYGILRHLLLGPVWSWYVVGFFAAGLGVITKGVGFLPLLIFLPWLYLLRRHRIEAPPGSAGLWWLGPLAFVAACGIWLVPMLLHVADAGSPELAAYRDEILHRQTVERYASPWGHLRPPWYFVVSVIPMLWFPTILLLPWLIRCWRTAIGAGDRATWIILCWIGMVLLFFSVSPGKRGVYILPLVPTLALVTGPWLAELHRKGVLRRIAITAFCLAIFVLAVMYLGPPFGILDSAGVNASVYQNVAGAWVLLALVCLIIFGLRRAVAGFAVFATLVWISAGWTVIPLANDKRSGRLIMPAAEAVVPSGGTLGLLRWKEQFLLYARRPLVHFGYRAKLTPELDATAAGWLSSAPGHRLLLADDDLAPCFTAGRPVSLGYAHGHHWFVIGPGEIAEDCSGDASVARPRRYAPP